jgi:hypothetical protein
MIETLNTFNRDLNRLKSVGFDNENDIWKVQKE